jgi:hypothetical protein
MLGFGKFSLLDEAVCRDNGAASVDCHCRIAICGDNRTVVSAECTVERHFRKRAVNLHAEYIIFAPYSGRHPVGVKAVENG